MIALNTPRITRVVMVSPAVRVSRSTPKPQARSQMAPMIRNARAPRSSAAASTLGGPFASAVPGGVRTWSTDRSTTLIAAGRPAATSEQPEGRGHAEHPQQPEGREQHRHGDRDVEGTVPQRRLGMRQRRPAPQGHHGEDEQDQPQGVGDRLPHRPVHVEVLQDLHGDAAAEEPGQQDHAPAAPMPGGGVDGWKDPQLRDCCGDSTKRARAPHSRATTMMRKIALRTVLR